METLFNSGEPIFEIPSLEEGEAAALERIEELRQALRFYVTNRRRWVGRVRRILSARAIQGSNSIEGINVSVEDALATGEGDGPTTAGAADWAATMGYRRAMTYVLQLAHDPHFEYTASLLRSLHFIMAEYDLQADPGRWRPGPIWVRNDATGGIVYEAPHEDRVPDLVEALIAQLKSHDDVPPMIRGAMGHLNLAMIHPFRDGNGRMSRCLQSLVLAREQILAPEWCSIEEYLGVNTLSYYEILAQVGQGSWNPHRDARPWVRYCLRAHFIQASSVLRRAKESERIWVELEDLIKKAGLPERAMFAVFDATVGLRIRNGSYRASLAQGEEEISNQVATKDLNAMVKAGLILKRGAQRGTWYEAAPILKEVRTRVRANRELINGDGLFEPGRNGRSGNAMETTAR